MKMMLVMAALLPAVSCTNIIENDFDRMEPELVVSGLLRQSDENHTVYVALSTGAVLVKVDDCNVRCLVNGELVAEGYTDASQYEWPEKEPYSDLYLNDPSYIQLPVTFGAGFAPGDKVRLEIEANGGAYKAETAEIVVPVPAPASEVGLSYYIDGYSQEERIALSVELPDIAEERNWYCSEVRSVVYGVWSFDDGGPDLVTESVNTVCLTDLDDPVLLDGCMPESAEIPIPNFTGDGTFETFSDKLFADATATLRMKLLRLYKGKFSSGNNVGFRDLFGLLIDEQGAEALSRRGKFATCSARRWIELCVSNCSEDTYRYLRALRTFRSDSYNPSYVEPVLFPDNVTGGIGYVDIIGSTVTIVPLPDEEETMENWYSDIED